MTLRKGEAVESISIFIHSIHACFSYREGQVGSSPRWTRNTSRSTAISGRSENSTDI